MTDELLKSVNECQVADLARAGKDLDPSLPESCEIFKGHVRSVQAAVIHTYQLTAAASLREKDAAEAAKLWKEMGEFCRAALKELKELKEVYSGCGTPELYDLALDYMSEADRRYYQNLQDSECAKTQLPPGLFPETK